MSVLEAALAYRKRGLAVLPLEGKKPHAVLIQKTHGGRAAGSVKRLASRGSDEEHVRAWFSNPNVNIGIFCGEPSGGLVVVDFDNCEFPPPGMTLPLTPTVKTGRDPLRGYHLYYRSDQPVLKRDFGWGEVRGWTNGAPVQIVAPPSRHPTTGRRYGWQLPIGDVPFADFDAVDLGELAASAASSTPPHLPPTNTNPLRTTKAVLLRPGTTTDTGEPWWHSYARSDEVAAASARALGITVPLRCPFPCLIHQEGEASASLHPAVETGHWLYHDFHAGKHGAPDWLTLPQVRALQAGRELPLEDSEHCTWGLILYVEAGVLAPVLVPARPLPPEVGGIVRHVYERFLFLLACRWNYTHGAPAPFDRRFAAALCNLPERAARAAIDELDRGGHIYIADKHGRTRLWLPSGITPPPTTRTR